MNIGEYSIQTPVTAWLLVIILTVGGWLGFQAMGKLEDPNFTIKQAKIITLYPGATAQQVQDEVTYHVEEALQLMRQVDKLDMSISRPGLSDISVTFKDHYRAEDFPNIYDELRRKLADIQVNLPQGIIGPKIIDDFGDVYGVYFALSGEGYSYFDLYDRALAIKKQLVLVDGVRKVVIDGEQQEVVYIDIPRERLGQLGISTQDIARILATQTAVLDAGQVRVGDEYLHIFPTGEFASVESIGNVLISSKEGRLIYLKDIASIERAYAEVPTQLYYLNGQPALTMGISFQSGKNVIAVGEVLNQRLQELKSIIPLGMELTPIYHQPQEVSQSVGGFIESVIQALAIVIVVLLIFMGLSTGLIIGLVLLITVAGTLLIMYLLGIELQRISLGALIIALGMLVDNAIVVAEGMLVRMRAGMSALKATKEVIDKSLWPLLGGTAIGILAFSAIGLSPDSTGEFTNSLFWVILISLSLSWLTAVSTTPLLCALLIRSGTPQTTPQEPYQGIIYNLYRGLVKVAIRGRWLTVSLVLMLFVIAVLGFGLVRNAFFPDSNTPMFFVDLYQPEGTDIRKTRDDTLEIANFLRELPGIKQTSTVIGGGHQRFALVYSQANFSSAYAQIIVQTENIAQIDVLVPQIYQFLYANYPHLDPLLKRLRIGPGRDSKIEARFSGEDPVILRNLADQAMAIMLDDADSKEVRQDWREPMKVIRPIYNEQVGRQLGITREDLASALQYAFEGIAVGTFYDGIYTLPMRMRAPENERQNISSIQDILVWSPVLKQSVPISQVVIDFKTDFENGLIRSRDRILTIIASANPISGDASGFLARVQPKIEALALPPGYQLAWGGEYEDASNAQAALFGSLPVGFLMMFITTVLLFGKLRQALVIWLTVPLALIGITAGLLAFDGAFDFMALLGALSLIGLLIKNAIVLIEEIDQEIAAGQAPYHAVVEASVSRLRPVILAAATTVLGLIPLLSDVFFVNMSITIMVGLTFATLLTLLIVPVLYALFFGIRPSPKT